MANCYFCGTQATDPGKGPSRWARAVIEDQQVLVCPPCQEEHPDWAAGAEACPSCGSKRLQKTLGDRVCRACGRQWGDDEFTLD